MIQQIGITLLFILMGVLLAVSMEAGMALWQQLILIVIAWLSVMAVLHSTYVQRQQRELMDNKQLLVEVMLSSSPVVVWSLSPNGEITSFSGRASRFTGMKNEKVIGQRIATFFRESPGLVREIQRALKGEKFVTFQEFKGRYYRHHFQPHNNRNGAVDAVHCVSVDLTKEKGLEKQLRLSSKIFSSTGDAIVVADSQRVIQSVNSAFTEITGFSEEDVLGIKLGLPRTASQNISFYKAVWRDLKNRDSWRGEIWSKRKTGELFSGRMTLKVVRGSEGEISNYVAFFSDVTDLKKSQEELRYLANHDSLTGLPNRRLFLDRLEQAIKRAKRANSRMAVYFIDLDEFKKINDNLGHHVGDSLLKEVGRRLQSVVREMDTVSRLAGDEFTIITENVSNPEEVSNIAKKVLGIFDLPFHLHDREFYVSASVGVGVFPDDGEDLVTLMKGADSAMYKAKADGRNGYYQLSHKKVSQEHSDLFFNSELRMALQRNQLSLVYQPQVMIQTGEIVGCEALMRWNHHTRGQVMPRTFIPLAEQAGLMHELGDWVLNSACQRMQQWRQDGLQLKYISVNVSLAQLRDPEFPEQVTRALKRANLPPDSLVIEVPEKALLVNLEDTRSFIKGLADLGVIISIDDFGTGKAPYGYLKNLPVGVIKIDQQLMKDIKIGKQNDNLVRAIFGLGDVLGLDVIAEGVERSIQEKYLHAVGCRFAQGFLYGKPMSADSFAQLFTKNVVS